MLALLRTAQATGKLGRAELDKDANIHPIATTQPISQGLEFLIKRCVEDSGQQTKRRAPAI